MATWNAQVGSLSMTLSHGAELRPYRTYAVSFKLKNGFQATVMNDIRIAAFWKEDSSCMRPLQGDLCTGEEMLQQSAVEVCAPGFTTKTIGQKYPWPGCDGASNHIAITLVSLSYSLFLSIYGRV